MRKPIICAVDYASDQDKTVAVLIRENKIIAMFEGANVLLKAQVWANTRNLKIDWVEEGKWKLPEDIEEF